MKDLFLHKAYNNQKKILDGDDDYVLFGPAYKTRLTIACVCKKMCWCRCR